MSDQRGNLLSGQKLKAINAYGQNLAAQSCGDYTNRLAALANVGQSATQQTATLGATAAQNAGTALINTGKVRGVRPPVRQRGVWRCIAMPRNRLEVADF